MAITAKMSIFYEQIDSFFHIYLLQLCISAIKLSEIVAISSQYLPAYLNF